MVKLNGKQPYSYYVTISMKPFKVINQVSPLLLSNYRVSSFVKCLVFVEVLTATACSSSMPARKNVDLCWLHVVSLGS